MRRHRRRPNPQKWALLLLGDLARTAANVEGSRPDRCVPATGVAKSGQLPGHKHPDVKLRID